MTLVNNSICLKTEYSLGLGLGIPLGILLVGGIYRAYTRPRDISSDVDMVKVAAAATMVNLSYKDPDRYTECVQQIDNKDIRQYLVENPIFVENPETDCQAYIWKIDYCIYLSYRGTEHIKDIIADMDIRTEPMNDVEVLHCCTGTQVRVHQGFHRQFFSTESDITKYIQQYIDEGCNSLFICGHSLGGALASIATYYYSKRYPELNISTMTFGSPRVGNREFSSDICHANTLRIYNFHDPISIIPFSFRFEHVHSPALCIDDSVNWLCQNRMSVQSTEGDLYWLLRPISLFRINVWAPIAAHSSRRYREFLTSLLSM